MSSRVNKKKFSGNVFLRQFKKWKIYFIIHKKKIGHFIVLGYMLLLKFCYFDYIFHVFNSIFLEFYISIGLFLFCILISKAIKR